MPVSIASLQKLTALGLSTEQMTGVINVLTVELAPIEERRAKDRERKILGRLNGKSTENPRTIHGTSVENPRIAPVEDNTLPSLTSGKEESKNLPLSPSKPLSDDPNGFEEFWNLYPKREKNYDRKGAVKAFRAALKRTDLQTIIDATRAYGDYLKANNKLNTEFVKQARSWLNGDFWTEFKPKPSEPLLANGKTYVKYGTDAGDAWVADYKAKGKIAPRDSNGGWFFPSEFPSEGATQ